MTISCIIPAYNAASFLRSTVESVLNQTRQPEEIIIIDDGSTDSTLNIASKIDGPIRVISQENSGSAVARNRGLDVANSKLIAFLDADDLWEQDFLEKQHSALSDESYDLSFSSFSNMDTLTGKFSQSNRLENSLLFNAPHYRQNEIAYFYEPLLNKLLMECPIVTTSTVVVKRSAIAKHNGFNPKLRRGQDYDLWLRMSEKLNFCWINETLVKRRLHDSNVTRDNLRIDRAQIEILSKWDFPGYFSLKSEYQAFRKRLAQLNFSVGWRLMKKDQVKESREYFKIASKLNLKYKTIAYLILSYLKF